ncbi:hypothetical protein [Loigolactobacillus rennini]|uniref:Uncharacterized protein n=1 Tax=Loigolactobacillus rennini DSM 20253 TaxID=1423796 RepID=A0A0R2D7R2_9LACO|nr:hypothetical protein [Loigolactobacillus rennini]KRM99905.1 hypothetical protein FC24_GL001737 [Loigolactobacillus rennini DSM 20253]
MLDQYRALYLGATAVSFKNKICQHWRTQPSVKQITAGPVMPIEAFGAKDTSRIFIREISGRDQIIAEKLKLTSQLPKKYNLNRVAGVDNADGIGIPEHEKDYGKRIWQTQQTLQFIPSRYAAMFKSQSQFSQQDLQQYRQLVADKDQNNQAYLKYLIFMLNHAEKFKVTTHDGLKFCYQLRTIVPDMINWGLYLLLKKHFIYLMSSIMKFKR